MYMYKSMCPNYCKINPTLCIIHVHLHTWVLCLTPTCMSPLMTEIIDYHLHLLCHTYRHVHIQSTYSVGTCIISLQTWVCWLPLSPRCQAGVCDPVADLLQQSGATSQEGRCYESWATSQSGCEWISVCMMQFQWSISLSLSLSLSQDLCDKLWDITDTRKDQAEQERQRIANDKWLEDHVGLLTNHFISVMQVIYTLIWPLQCTCVYTAYNVCLDIKTSTCASLNTDACMCPLSGWTGSLLWHLHAPQGLLHWNGG